MMQKRILDILVCLLLLPLFLVISLPIALAIKLTSKGNILIWSKRIGRGNKLFLMPKFRSMRIDTPQVATHLLSNPEYYITSVGKFLRKTSLDELPQLISVLSGQMSLVGPRPALFNQDDLVQLRTKVNVHLLKPGITGWAQINGRDDIAVAAKVALDAEYLKRQSFSFDLKIMVLTAVQVLKKENISH